MIHLEDSKPNLLARPQTSEKNFISIEQDFKYNSKVQRNDVQNKAFSSETHHLKNWDAKARELQIKKNFVKIKNIVIKEYSRHYSSGVSGETSSGAEEESSEKSEMDFTREDPSPRLMIPRKMEKGNNLGRGRALETQSKSKKVGKKVVKVITGVESRQSQKQPPRLYNPVDLRKKEDTERSRSGSRRVIKSKYESTQSKVKVWNEEEFRSNKQEDSPKNAKNKKSESVILSQKNLETFSSPSNKHVKTSKSDKPPPFKAGGAYVNKEKVKYMSPQQRKMAKKREEELATSNKFIQIHAAVDENVVENEIQQRRPSKPIEFHISLASMDKEEIESKNLSQEKIIRTITGTKEPKPQKQKKTEPVSRSSKAQSIKSVNTKEQVLKKPKNATKEEYTKSSKQSNNSSQKRIESVAKAQKSSGKESPANLGRGLRPGRLVKNPQTLNLKPDPHELKHSSSKRKFEVNLNEIKESVQEDQVTELDIQMSDRDYPLVPDQDLQNIQDDRATLQGTEESEPFVDMGKYSQDQSFDDKTEVVAEAENQARLNHTEIDLIQVIPEENSQISDGSLKDANLTADMAKNIKSMRVDTLDSCDFHNDTIDKELKKEDQFTSSPIRHREPSNDVSFPGQILGNSLLQISGIYHNSYARRDTMMSYYSENTGGFDPNDESFADTLNKSRGSGFSEEKSDFIQINNAQIDEEDESEDDLSSKHSISKSQRSIRETNIAVELECEQLFIEEECEPLKGQDCIDPILRSHQELELPVPAEFSKIEYTHKLLWIPPVLPVDEIDNGQVEEFEISPVPEQFEKSWNPSGYIKRLPTIDLAQVELKTLGEMAVELAEDWIDEDFESALEIHEGSIDPYFEPDIINFQESEILLLPNKAISQYSSTQDAQESYFEEFDSCDEEECTEPDVFGCEAIQGNEQFDEVLYMVEQILEEARKEEERVRREKMKTELGIELDHDDEIKSLLSQSNPDTVVEEVPSYVREFGEDQRDNQNLSVDYSAIGSEKLGLEDILAMQNDLNSSQANLNQSDDFGGVGNRSFDHGHGGSILDDDVHSYSVMRSNTQFERESDEMPISDREDETTEVGDLGQISNMEKAFTKEEKSPNLDVVKKSQGETPKESSAEYLDKSINKQITQNDIKLNTKPQSSSEKNDEYKVGENEDSDDAGENSSQESSGFGSSSQEHKDSSGSDSEENNHSNQAGEILEKNQKQEAVKLVHDGDEILEKISKSSGFEGTASDDEKPSEQGSIQGVNSIKDNLEASSELQTVEDHNLKTEQTSDNSLREEVELTEKDKEGLSPSREKSISSKSQEKVQVILGKDDSSDQSDSSGFGSSDNESESEKASSDNQSEKKSKDEPVQNPLEHNILAEDEDDKQLDNENNKRGDSTLKESPSSSDIDESDSETVSNLNLEQQDGIEDSNLENQHIDTPRLDLHLQKVDPEPQKAPIESPQKTEAKPSMWGSFWKTVVDITSNPEKLLDQSNTQRQKDQQIVQEVTPFNNDLEKQTTIVSEATSESIKPPTEYLSSDSEDSSDAGITNTNEEETIKKSQSFTQIGDQISGKDQQVDSEILQTKPSYPPENLDDSKSEIAASIEEEQSKLKDASGTAEVLEDHIPDIINEVSTGQKQQELQEFSEKHSEPLDETSVNQQEQIQNERQEPEKSGLEANEKTETQPDELSEDSVKSQINITALEVPNSKEGSSKQSDGPEKQSLSKSGSDDSSGFDDASEDEHGKDSEELVADQEKSEGEKHNHKNSESSEEDQDSDKSDNRLDARPKSSSQKSEIDKNDTQEAPLDTQLPESNTQLEKNTEINLSIMEVLARIILWETSDVLEDLSESDKSDCGVSSSLSLLQKDSTITQQDVE